MYPEIFPTLPRDTCEATEAAFGKKNLYIVIGDQANSLFAEIDFADLCPPEHLSKELICRLCLVTVFQFKEWIADQQAQEATRVRTDWKYALHLSLIHPGLDARALCDFRQCLFANARAQARFQMLLSRLHKIGFLAQEPGPADASLVLHSVCRCSRLELVAAAMRAAVASLVAVQPEWLRGIMRPHWYQRYSRNHSALQIPDNLAHQGELAESIGYDGVCLLDAIAQANATTLSELIEIQALKHIWSVEFEKQDDRCKWRASECARCIQREGHRLAMSGGARSERREL